MLRNSPDLGGFISSGIDGTIGHVKDLSFDEEAWVVRNLVSHWRFAFEPKSLIAQFAAEFPLIRPTPFPGMGAD